MEIKEGKIKLIPLKDLKENQQVIVVDYDEPNNIDHYCIGRVEGLYEYKLRFWNKANNDEEKSIWISSELNEFENRNFNYETRLAFLRSLIIESLGNQYSLDYAQWVEVLNNNKIDAYVKFHLNQNYATIIY